MTALLTALLLITAMVILWINHLATSRMLNDAVQTVQQRVVTKNPNPKQSENIHSPFPSKSYWIPTQRLDPLKSRTLITIREVTDSNKLFVPSFEKVGFQFIDVSKLNSVGTGRLREYHHSLSVIGRSIKQKRRLNHYGSVFQDIITDLSRIHGLDFRIGDFYFCRKRPNHRQETHIHFDLNGEGHRLRGEEEGGGGIPKGGLFRSRGHFRLWIPLHDIDNLSLGMGDTNKLKDRLCASKDGKRDEECRDDFEKVVWYHQSTMRRQDIILFANGRVPHYSVNKGSEAETQNRSALAIDLHVWD